MSAPDRCPRCGMAGTSSGASFDPSFLARIDEHLPDLGLVCRIEQRNVHLGAALAFEVDRQQIGSRREQHPDDAAAVLRVAHLRRDHAEDAARRAGVAVLLAAAERGVGLVDDDDHRAHGAKDGQHALEIALRLAHILRSEVLQHHAGHADLAARRTGRGTTCPCRPARRSDSPSAGCRAMPRLSSAASSRSRALAASWPTTVSSVHFGSMNSSSPWHCRSISRFFELAEHAGVEPAAAFARRLHEDVEVGERDAGGQRRQLRGVVSPRTPASAAGVDGGVRRSARARLRPGSGTSIEATCGLPVRRSLRSAQLLVHQHERHVQPLHVRTGRPVEHRHELRRRLRRSSVRARRTGRRTKPGR